MMNVELARRHTVDPFYYEYSKRDCIVYALGIGCTTKDDLRYIYEGALGFMALPTFIVAPGLQANKILDWPGLNIEPARTLHGEQYIEMFAPLTTEGKLRSETRVLDVIDKGSGALIITEITTFEARSERKLAIQQIGQGNFGGAKTSPHEKKGAEIPKRPADKIRSESTSKDQATLYRMGSGDLNLAHIDPDTAKAFANNDASRFKAIKVRFASPVFPGQTLETHMWDEGSRIVFETKVKETGKTVISNGYLLLRGNAHE